MIRQMAQGDFAFVALLSNYEGSAFRERKKAFLRRPFAEMCGSFSMGLSERVCLVNYDL